METHDLVVQDLPWGVSEGPGTQLIQRVLHLPILAACSMFGECHRVCTWNSHGDWSGTSISEQNECLTHHPTTEQFFWVQISLLNLVALKIFVQISFLLYESGIKQKTGGTLQQV